MEQTWRWFGESDPIPLAHIAQAGATGIVTALHHVPAGVAWPADEIAGRKALIEASGLSWSVVESIPTPDAIKLGGAQARPAIDAWKDSLAAVDAPANGLTLCAGSYGSRPDNDVVAMAREFAPRVHFAHLRNVTIEADGSFYEAEHLDGGVDMIALMEALLGEERAAKLGGRRTNIPLRPDHGHLLADDAHKRTNPGYSYIGRLKGLAELRGVMRALVQ